MNRMLLYIFLSLLAAPLFISAAVEPDPEQNAAAQQEPLYWVAPMDPNYRRDQPGKSPMGMDLIPVYANRSGDPGTVSISPAVIQSLGVRTALAERDRLWRRIDTVGYVDYDETRLGHIHLRTIGWVENLRVRSVGERVNRGDVLFDYYSPELVNAQQEYIQALGSTNQRLVSASRERLGALGVHPDTIAEIARKRVALQRIPIYAPQDGIVADLAVREGMYVQPSLRVMSLADLSSVWLQADVFERQANWVALGQKADVQLAYLPGETLAGTVEYIYPALDPQTRTLKVRLRFDNPGEVLKPNMYASVRIYGGPAPATTVIPVEALIRTGFEERVIIALGDGRFQARKVRPGIESGEWVQILAGVEPGESVVVSAQFLIDSEASFRSSLRRMSEPPRPGSGAPGND